MSNNNANKLPMLFKTELLHQELKRIPERLWQPFLNNHTSTFWKGVALRSNDRSPTTLTVGSEYFDTSLIEKLSAFREILNSFECNLKRVRLSKLEPGGIIGKHRDIFPGERILEVRLQIPIQTNENVSFIIENLQIKMKEGELWYLDVSKEHSVENNGVTKRIHLIIDCEINDWLKKLIPTLNNL